MVTKEALVTVGQTVQWQGDVNLYDTSDGPCIIGQCVGTVLKVDEDGTTARWNTMCEGHESDGSEGPCQFVATGQLLPVPC